MSQIGLRAGQLCARKQVSLERLPVHARARNCRTLLRARASASAAEEDKPVVFVAGGVGRTGIRVVRELTERGFKARLPHSLQRRSVCQATVNWQIGND